MNREDFIKKVDEKVKLIRNERGFTQDKMAEVLGISKKTLVQIEKERASLGWATSIAVCTIFRDSEILNLAFGGETQDIISSLAFDNYEEQHDRTMGGKLWWEDIEFKGRYKIQQNVVSKHYRVLDNENRRVCSSFEIEYIKQRLNELSSTII